jgi:hypothetical protein
MAKMPKTGSEQAAAFVESLAAANREFGSVMLRDLEAVGTCFGVARPSVSARHRRRASVRGRRLVGLRGAVGERPDRRAARADLSRRPALRRVA